jgi:hypothetical protein
MLLQAVLAACIKTLRTYTAFLLPARNVMHVNHCMQGTGTEQHRHNFAEVAVYNMLSYLWEIETGTVYKMAKAHDIYSGLGEG